MLKLDETRVKKYTKGKHITLSQVNRHLSLIRNQLIPQNVGNKRLLRSLVKARELEKISAVSAVRAEILLPEESGFLEAEGNEKTHLISQKEIIDEVDLASQKKVRMNDAARTVDCMLTFVVRSFR